MKPSILIIDDDVDICFLLQKYLTKKDFKVDTAFSANKAFKSLKEKKYDVVFCDYRLGDKDGLEVLQEIKEMHPKTEEIIITAYSDIQTAVKLITSGSFDDIAKPLVPEEFVHLISHAFEHAKQTARDTAPAQVSEKRRQSTTKKDEFYRGEGSAIKEL